MNLHVVWGHIQLEILLEVLNKVCLAGELPGELVRQECSLLRGAVVDHLRV